MYILGLSCFYHDSAAALIKNGEVIAAAQEERFTRKKHDPSFPSNAINYCLKEANIGPNEIENVVFYEKPLLKFERLLETYLAFAPRGFKSFQKSMPLWITEKLFQKSVLISELRECLGQEHNWKQKLLFSEHHLSHAASAFYPSPFQKAAILTIDGVGEWATTSICIGKGNSIEVIKEINFPHSLGLIYSAFTYYTGFKVNSGEYKIMGLAPYGKPKYSDLILQKLIKLANDGSFKLNMNYFDFATGLTMTNAKFHKLFGAPPRTPESPITQREMDLAASIQLVTEKIILNLAGYVAKSTGENNLCLAGGVALNCVANGILRKEKIFKNIWIQPAAGDAGGALGAALVAHHQYHQKFRKISDNIDAMNGSYLGPAFNKNEIKKDLLSCGAEFTEWSDNGLIKEVVSALKKGKIVGWMQGRMEFGPRALGARSILADPRSKIMQKQLNLKVKYRESFRPFAPSILKEDIEAWFEDDWESPYMLFVSKIKEKYRLSMTDEEKKLFGIAKLNIPKSSVPSVTHVDYSSRIQTVHKETNPRFHKLISQFKVETGCPILVNTSFNIRGEPIVCSPEDAYKCFMGTEIDMLVIENFLLNKTDQDPKLFSRYKESYELD